MAISPYERVKMDIGALQLTGMALGLLILISILFIGLTRGLQWLTSRSWGKNPEGAMTAERKTALITAALTSYLEAEQEGEDEEKI
jgi:Na+-driven multidrug efflux pump